MKKLIAGYLRAVRRARWVYLAMTPLGFGLDLLIGRAFWGYVVVMGSVTLVAWALQLRYRRNNYRKARS